MKYKSEYNSKIGKILILATDTALCGVWFYNQKYFASIVDEEAIERENDIIIKTKKWLDIYFDGKDPQYKIPIEFHGTAFQKEVWKILEDIPYGKTITYGDIAKILEKKLNIKKMSAQAVGSAVGRNEISIIIPCHRVIGKNKALVGYAGGLDKKEKLLKLEKII